MTHGALELVWDGWAADLRREGGQFILGGGLETCVLVSVFSNARAPAALTPELRPEERGGWWAEDPADPHGSLLWLTGRAKETPETANRAREWTRQALGWMIREGIVERLVVTASYVDHVLYVQVQLIRGNARRWALAWDALKAGTYNAGKTTIQLIAA